MDQEDDINMQKLKKKLSKNKDLYATLYNNHHSPMLLIDTSTAKIIDANQAACNFYGYQKNELVRKKITDINILPEEQVFKEMQKTLLIQGKNLQFRHRLASGEIKDVEVFTGPIRLLNNNFIFSIIHDITERVKLDKALEIAYAEIMQTLNAVSDIIIVIDKEFNILRINKKFYLSFNINKEDIAGKKCFDIFYHDFCNTPNCPLQKILNGEEYVKFEIVREIERRKVTYLVVCTPVFDEDGVLIGIVQSCRDISDRKQQEAQILEYSRLLEGVLSGIPDIIGVYKPDYTIVFYNQAGYDFFKTRYEKVKDKKCYELLGRKQKCYQCSTQKAIETRKLEKIEKYIPELNKYMECFSNPILDDNGEVILVVEQLRDISDRKKYEISLKENEEQYRSLVELSPDAIIVIYDERIVIANLSAVSLMSMTKNELIGKKIYKFIHPDYYEFVKENIGKQLINTLFEIKLIRNDGTVLDVEVRSSMFNYRGNPAVQAVIRDITDRKRTYERAARIQRQRLDTEFPLTQKADLEIIYLPAETVSGDFFHFYQVDEYNVIGLLGDVCGKGFSAAMTNALIKVLFNNVISIAKEPINVLNILNQDLKKYIVEEEYIAACCFNFNFKQNEITIASAGINQFIFKHGHFYCVEEIIQGPFLGMFDELLFEQKILNFIKGDRFYFYTDGIEVLMENLQIIDRLTQLSLAEQKELIINTINRFGKQKDDVTWLGIEIK